jgi:hypothetical protein
MHGIYYNNAWSANLPGPNFIPYSNFFQANFQLDGWYEVSLGEFGKLNAAGGSLPRKAIVDMLNRVGSAYQALPEEALREVAKSKQSALGTSNRPLDHSRQMLGDSITKHPLVVKDLTPTRGVDEQTASALSDVIRDTISKSGRYNVQSLHDLAAVSKVVEEKLKLGCDDTKCLVELAGALGTDLVVAGSLSKFGDTYSFSLRLIQSRGENLGVIERVSKQCQCSEEELIATTKELARQLISKIQ